MQFTGVGETRRKLLQPVSSSTPWMTLHVLSISITNSYRFRSELGRHLLRDAIHRSWRNTTEVASAGVVVDALDDAARTFYIHHEFIPLLDHRNRLFLAMVTIDRAFKARRRQKRVLESGSHSSKSDKQNKAARAAPERADRWAQNPTSNQI